MAAFPAASAMLVPAALAALTSEHPDLDVELREAEPAQALEQVRSGEVDLTLVFTYPEAEPLTGPELTARSPARRGVELCALREDRWGAGCPHCSAHLKRACAEAGFVPDVRHTTEGYVLPQALVAENLAVTFLPRLAPECYRHSGAPVVEAAAAITRTAAGKLLG